MKRTSHPRTVKTLQLQHQQQQKVSSKVDEKKLQHGYGSSKIMSKSNNKKDIFELQKPLQTSFSCITDVLKAYSNGTEELRRLLNLECEIIYECKVCRSLYRSLSNFVQHKKYHCSERYCDFKQTLNKELVEKYTHINGNDPKGQLLATRKTFKKGVYELLNKVGNLSVEPLPDHFFTKDLKETEVALLNFFRQEGTAESEERNATVDADGMIVETASTTSFEEQLSALPRLQDRDMLSSEAENQSPNLTASREIKISSSSPSSLVSPSTNQNGQPEFRAVYQCPQCNKDLSSIFTVHRHLGRVHGMAVKQVRKMRKLITKKMMRVNDVRLLNSTSGKKQDSKLLEGRLICDSSILCGPQPRVVLTKTSCPGGSYSSSPSSIGVCPKTTATSPERSEDQVMHRRPQKKLKIDTKAWLRKGPSVPVLNGPLTRTARALYGSPSDVSDWNQRNGDDREGSGCSDDADCSDGEVEGVQINNAGSLRTLINRDHESCSGSGSIIQDKEKEYLKSDLLNAGGTEDLQENESKLATAVQNGRRDSTSSVPSIDSTSRICRRSQSDERTSSTSSSMSSFEEAATHQRDPDDSNDDKSDSYSVIESSCGYEQDRVSMSQRSPKETDDSASNPCKSYLINLSNDHSASTKESENFADGSMLSENVMDIIVGPSTTTRYSLCFYSPDESS